MVPRNVLTHIDIIAQVLDGAKKLVEYLPSISTTIEEVRETEKQLKIDLANIKATLDSKVAIMLTDLQEEFQVVIRVGKGFLQSCCSMTTYAIDENHLNEINKVKVRQVEGVYRFVKRLLGKL